ncbi:MAG TPA: hypothetical protein VFS08_01080 [Gemmatimonadaceae bacterium]|nr:hypothetical protein [Gemmatimonadaceae bacterium]
MTAHLAALLLGLFAVPLAALVLGHRLARRPARQRAAFWGIVVGHTVAALVATAAALHDPVRWDTGDQLRGLFGYWLMPIGGVAGAALGWMAGRKGEREG